MQDFEIRTINSAEHQQSVWKRYLDNTFVVLRSANKDRFLKPFNNIDPCIQFTVEDTRVEGFIASWTPWWCQNLTNPSQQQCTESPLIQTNTCNGTVFTTGLLNLVSLTPWHTEPRLSAPGHSWLSRKKITREMHCSTQIMPQTEPNAKQQDPQGHNTRNKLSHNKSKNTDIVISYSWGLSESCKNICSKHDIQIHLKRSKTIRDLLVNPKTRISSCRSLVFSGTVHWFWRKTSFHPLLWTSSGLKGTWNLSAHIGLGSLRCAKSVKTSNN